MRSNEMNINFKGFNATMQDTEFSEYGKGIIVNKLLFQLSSFSTKSDRSRYACCFILEIFLVIILVAGSNLGIVDDNNHILLGDFLGNQLESKSITWYFFAALRFNK